MTDTPSNGKHDVWTHRITTASIGVFVLADTVAIAILAAHGIDIPWFLQAAGITAATVLATTVQTFMKGNKEC